MSRRASTRACSVSFLTSGDGRRLVLLGPQLQGRNPLGGQALRLPGIEFLDRRLPLPQELQGGQPLRQAAFREGAGHFQSGLLRIGRQPPHGRLANRRTPLVELLHQPHHGCGIGFVAAEQHLVGLGRRGLVLLLQPTHQVLGRKQTLLRGHRLAQHRADPQGRQGGDVQVGDLFLRLVRIEVDQGPPRQFGLDRWHFDLGVEFVARPAPDRADADEQRLAVRRRPPLTFRQARQPGQGLFGRRGLIGLAILLGLIVLAEQGLFGRGGLLGLVILLGLIVLAEDELQASPLHKGRRFRRWPGREGRVVVAPHRRGKEQEKGQSAKY